MANGLSSLTTQFWVSSEVTAKAETEHIERTKTAVKIELINRLIFIVIITPLEINVDKEKKMVDIWLTKAEKNDEKLKESLKEVYKKYSEQKYMVAVFMSGEQDLYENTRDLLLYNRRRMAEKEVQAERIARSAV